MLKSDKLLNSFAVPAELGKRLVGLKSSGYKDYLAARILFNQNELHQACFFANTCIEKELKACLYALNVEVSKKSHDTINLYNTLLFRNKALAEILNKEFIKVLSKIYRSRYYESLEANYNFVIIKNKFLAELDYTYSTLEAKVRYKTGSTSELIEPLYSSQIKLKNSSLFLNNYVLNNIKKEEFLKNRDMVHEFRMHFNHETFEAVYEIPYNPNVDFIFEGLKPDTNSSFIVSHKFPNLKVSAIRNGELQIVNPE